MEKTLTNLEITILHCLARGSDYRATCKELGKTRPGEGLTEAALYTHCLRIRKKTGIIDTRDGKEVLRYMVRSGFLPATMLPKPQTPAAVEKLNKPTPKQETAMRLLAAGYTYAQIAHSMNITKQGAQNTISLGCSRAGVSASGCGQLRVDAVRRYFAAIDKAAEWKPTPKPGYSFNLDDY